MKTEHGRRGGGTLLSCHGQRISPFGRPIMSSVVERSARLSRQAAFPVPCGTLRLEHSEKGARDLNHTDASSTFI